MKILVRLHPMQVAIGGAGSLAIREKLLTYRCLPIEDNIHMPLRRKKRGGHEVRSIITYHPKDGIILQNV